MGTTIQFAWMDNSFDDSGIRIYEQGIAAPVVDNIPGNASTGDVSFNWANLPCNKIATFVVKAFNAQGESAATNNANAFTIPCSPTNLSATAASSTSINVSFQDNATNETEFRIYVVSLTTQLGTLSANPGQGIRSAAFNSLSCGTNYSLFVRAFNGAGESSDRNKFEVMTQACTVTVTFAQIYLINGGDNSAPVWFTSSSRLNCGAEGNVWLDYTVNGQSKRWPAYNYLEINDGETKAIDGISHTVVLPQSQELGFTVSGMNKNSRVPDLPLGTLTRSFLGNANWGEGSHAEEPPCSNPGGRYEITYNIWIKP